MRRATLRGERDRKTTNFQHLLEAAGHEGSCHFVAGADPTTNKAFLGGFPVFAESRSHGVGLDDQPSRWLVEIGIGDGSLEVHCP